MSVTPPFFFLWTKVCSFIFIAFVLITLSLLSQQVLFLTDKILLKEKHRENSVTSELNEPKLQSQKEVTTSAAELKNVPIIVPKQEDLSSANSAVFDSDSPHCTDGGHSSLLEPADSSNIFELDQSDVSHTEEEEQEDLGRSLLHPAFHFPKLEDSAYLDPPVNSCNYGILVEDQTCWYWP